MASKTGDQNIMGALAYFFTFISGIVFLLIEKKNPFVRFHAMQSTITFGGLFIVYLIAGFLPGINGILLPVIWVVMVVLWVFLMFKAFSGEKYKLPIVGDIAEKQLAKMK